MSKSFVVGRKYKLVNLAALEELVGWEIGATLSIPVEGFVVSGINDIGAFSKDVTWEQEAWTPEANQGRCPNGWGTAQHCLLESGAFEEVTG